MARHLIHSRYGPLPAEVVQGVGDADRPWRATLVEHHPMLTSVLGAVGASERRAVGNLAGAVARFGSDWPVPPRSGTLERASFQFVRAERVDMVLIDVDGDGQRAAWAVGWRGQQVWVVWHGGCLDGTAWVPASSVHRPSSTLLG